MKRAAGTADRYRPFHVRRPFVRGGACTRLVLPLALLSAISTAATLAAPWLRGWPLLLMALSPRLPFLLLAAPRTGAATFMVVGTVRLCLADPFHFRLGRWFAARTPWCSVPSAPAGLAPGRFPGMRWLAGRGLVRVAAAVAVLVRPNGRHLALAGASGLAARVVAAVDLAGTVGYLAGLYAAAVRFS